MNNKQEKPTYRHQRKSWSPALLWKVGIFLLMSLVSVNSYAAVCSVVGSVPSVLTSSGDSGVRIAGSTGNCSCAYSDDGTVLTWVDIDTDGGKSMLAAVVAAQDKGRRVRATFQDGLGQGSAGNGSITYRYWSDCKLQALEVLGPVWNLDAVGGELLPEQAIDILQTGWGGEAFFVSVQQGPSATTCSNNTELRISNANPMREEMVSLLISSFHTSQPVRLYVKGCLGSHVHLTAVRAE